LTGIFPKASFIIIPNTDCYTMKDELIKKILALPRPAFIGFTAGPAAKVMIHQLYPTIGNESFLIDFGSLWDVYVGHRSRKYHKSMMSYTIRKNILGP